MGLPAIECKGITQIVEEGHEIEINLPAGQIRNLSNGERKECSRFSTRAIDILDKGGLIPFLRETLGKKGKGKKKRVKG